MVGQGPMTGRVFNNRYQIEDRIGIGGMAEVYRAQDTVLGRVVAVKVMLPQYAADPDFTQRFRQEAAAAANLQSPYIVNVYDWGAEGETYFIVMEFVRGSDLKTAIQQRGAINQRKVAEIGVQVCQALAVAHGQDIVHRDIKPQNIMVQPDGNIKVMDFGIARAKNSVMSRTSSVLGTAHYISPEQAQGKELTPASDIYSLGVVLYEAATGTLPFDGPDAMSVALMQVNDFPPMPHEVNPDIDPDLETIIMMALEKDPARRFATVGDMRLALNDYLMGRAIGSAMTAVMPGVMPADAATRVMSPIDGAGMIDATQAMPSVAPGAPGREGGSATSYRNAPTPQKKSKKVPIIVGCVVAVIALAAIAAFAFLGGSGKPVPDVTGKTLEEATHILEAEGFKVGTTNSAYDEKVEEGHVISQDPRANSRAEEGTKVNLVLSQGTEQVTVPDLRNKTIDEAKRLASEAGVTLSAAPGEYSSDVDVNRIISQNPPGGSKVPKGSIVEYVISLGPESVAVPNVVGSSESNAISTLQSAGFEVYVQYEFSSSYSAGVVMYQNPSSGTKMEKDSTVTITVSKGPEPKPEPTPDPEPPSGGDTNTGGEDGKDEQP